MSDSFILPKSSNSCSRERFVHYEYLSISAVDSSKTTHGAASCLSACRYFTALLLGVLEGASKSEILSERYAPSFVCSFCK